MFTGVLKKRNGAGHGVRTRDIQLGKQGNTTQKSLKTLGEMNLGVNSVTQNVTQKAGNVNKEVFLQVLKEISRDELIAVLADALAGKVDSGENMTH